MKPLSEALTPIAATLSAQAQQSHTQPHGLTSSAGQSNTTALTTVEKKNQLMTLSEGHGRKWLDTVMEDKAINWLGHKFAQYATAPEVPVIPKGSAIYAAAKREAEALEQKMQPAEQRHLAALMYRLQGHYARQQMTDAQAKGVAQDYARLLAHFPQDIIEKAYDEILLDAHINFFPTIAQLNAKMEPKYYARKWRLKRLTILLERAE